MSISDNINTIESDIGTFFDGLKTHALDPIKTAIAAGGKDIAADGNAVIGVATAVALAASKVPGTVGAIATGVETFIPFAQQLLAFFSGGSSPAVAAMTATPVAPGAALS